MQWVGFCNLMPFTCKICPDHVIEAFKFAGTCARYQGRKDALESWQKHITVLEYLFVICGLRIFQ